MLLKWRQALKQSGGEAVRRREWRSSSSSAVLYLHCASSASSCKYDAAGRRHANSNSKYRSHRHAGANW
jgi:hypothetical protein